MGISMSVRNGNKSAFKKTVVELPVLEGKLSSHLSGPSFLKTRTSLQYSSTSGNLIKTKL